MKVEVLKGKGLYEGATFTVIDGKITGGTWAVYSEGKVSLSWRVNGQVMLSTWYHEFHDEAARELVSVIQSWAEGGDALA